VAHPLPDYERDSSLRELLRSARYARLRFAAPAGESGSTKAEQFTEKNLHRPEKWEARTPEVAASCKPRINFRKKKQKLFDMILILIKVLKVYHPQAPEKNSISQLLK
jgi:hypothetical protein